ncbi:ROK family transcriptional regulator [Streptomyces sp. PTM05]|uniref:ROK family transcriptional regulator n=1 Tax=Streptantibioticus parmotrematis TaxID=2873249 RepID=A0ABS7R1P4_9ACTN|nr:ROK family transcriptional regulator [Streptantibioticus parmotrematis]MBY8887942.1 ROK family transcriptional regulator [Streptantibioticus parmotrematis]
MNSGIPGAGLPALRDHNAALVLDLLRVATVADGGAGISRQELATRTGLTPQAVSKIVARLAGQGLVAEAGRGASTGGKPRTLLRLVRQARYAVGLHLDRDELTVVLVDLAGEAVTERVTPFDLGAGPGAVLEAVAERVREVTSDVPGAERVLLGAGAAAPGPLDHAAGVLGRVTGFPGWDGFALADALAGRLGLPVTLDKDTNAAALRVPADGPRPASFAYLHVGSGLGAGLVLDGALYRGPRTGAGEFGHQTLEPDGPRCACGRRGCLEALCLAALADGDTARAARLLAVGAANLAALLDIDRVVLGGRAVTPAFRDEVAAALAREAAPGTVRVARECAGARTIAEGAAWLVLAPLFGRRRFGFWRRFLAAVPDDGF